MSGWLTLAAGIQKPSSRESSIRAVVATLDGLGDSLESPAPAQVVAAVAEQLASQAGVTLSASKLRLFDRPLLGDAVAEQVAEAATGLSLADSDAPYALGRVYELLLAPQQRQRAGAHLTSATVAQGLVGCVPFNSATDAGPARVLDPAVGGAAFLLAAASRQIEAGHDADAIFDRLHGFDIDETAVAVAEAALALWLVQNNRPPRANPRLCAGDGLVDQLPAADVVVGNPPFLNQLQRTSARTAERRRQLQDVWGELAGAYTDDAWLFVAAGLKALDGGVLAMVQPLSILSARHAAPVRRRIASNHALSGLWVPFAKVFDAAVDVCGVVVASNAAGSRAMPVQRWRGTGFEPCASVAPGAPSEMQGDEMVTWGPFAAEMQGVPRAVLPQAHTTSCLADLATTTAGFRRQFYGLKPYVSERDRKATAANRLVTVGMIDPLVLAWGRKPFAFAGDQYREPVLDLVALADDDPALGNWIEARQRPKILVATQTRIIETWVDDVGDAVPATPVISVEPHHARDLWALVALLNAPVINAWIAGASFGTALSINAIKFSAKDLGILPLPTNNDAWQQAAELLREGARNTAATAGGPFAIAGLPAEFAAAMGRAYDDTSAASQWWQDRLAPLLERHR